MWRQYGRKNKYNAKPTYYKGVRYDSAREADYAAELDLRKLAGDVRDWKRQVKIPLCFGEDHICDMRCDFEVTLKNGTREMHEVKGHETDVYKLKKKILEVTWLRQNPAIKYVIVK